MYNIITQGIFTITKKKIIDFEIFYSTAIL